ncbi:MAG: riboflavin kinase [Patescibacteria group bacterium]
MKIYTISGKVIKGDGYGRKIGFPTANIERRGFANLKTKPKLGIYAGNVEISDKIYKAGIIIGPVDKNNLPKIEAHLIGFKKDIYGEKIELRLEKFIRKFMNFETEKELIIQIKKDLKKC